MGRYQIHQSDANQAEIVAFLEAHGASVDVIGRPVDLLVGFLGVTAAVEVKRGNGKLRASQVQFFARFHGLSAVLRNESDAEELLDQMRVRAKAIAAVRCGGAHPCYRCRTPTTLGTAWCQACLDDAKRFHERYPPRKPKFPEVLPRKRAVAAVGGQA